MIPYTRVTVVTPSSRAEAVLPSDEPLGTQLPALLGLLGLGNQTQLGPVRLVRTDGRTIDLEQDLDAQNVLDGEVLRVVPDDEIPPPIEVADISGALARSTDTHPGRWSSRDRITGTGGLLGLAATIASWPWVTSLAASPAPWTTFLPGLGILAIAALLWRALAVTGRGPGILVFCLAMGLLAPALWTTGWPQSPARDEALCLAASLIAAGLAALGRSRTGWALGAVLGLVLQGLWLALSQVASSPELARGVLGTLALVFLGALPWAALLISGISRLDNAALAGALPLRHELARSLSTAHDTMTGACLALSGTIAWACTGLAQQGSAWAEGLAAALTLALVLRSRAFPLRYEVLSMWTMAVPPTLALSTLLPTEHLRLSGLLILTATLALASLYQPTAQARIRLRRAGDMVEALATVSALPLLCGLGGLFDHLLGLFA